MSTGTSHPSGDLRNRIVSRPTGPSTSHGSISPSFIDQGDTPPSQMHSPVRVRPPVEEEDKKNQVILWEHCSTQQPDLMSL